jgi:hypothetical protein
VRGPIEPACHAGYGRGLRGEVRRRSKPIRSSDGLVLTIRQSKTDQEREGQTIGIPYGSHPETCPVRAVRTWLERSHVGSGFLFRVIGRWGREVTANAICDHQLAKIIKALGRRAASIRPRSLAIPSAPDSLPRRPRAAPPSAPSWNRPGTSRSSRSGNTSAAAVCSAITPPRAAGCERWACS